MEKKKERHEPVYPVQELAEGAEHLFGIRPECVRAAFKEAKRQEATVTETKRILAVFMRKEIR